MTSTLPPLIQAFSGAVGSAAANTLSYPLDLVSTRLQTTSSRKLRGFRGILLTLKHVLETEGWRGLYDGLTTDTTATLLSSFLYFYFYSFLRTFITRRRIGASPGVKVAKPILLSMPEEIGIGFLAGVASRAISTPLSVVTVRLQTASENEEEEKPDEEKGDGVTRPVASPIQVLRDINTEEGLRGLWRGFFMAIPLSFNPAITMSLFQIFRRIMARHSRSPVAAPTPRSAFLGASFSNTIATVLLYPLMLAKTRLQVHHNRVQGSNNQLVGLLTIWKTSIAEDGWKGLYQGLEAQILKGFINQGITMMVKQRIELLVVAIYLQYHVRGR